jgi:hypothetical protein
MQLTLQDAFALAARGNNAASRVAAFSVHNDQQESSLRQGRLIKP